MTLPPPSAAPHGPYRIALVCLGNICRSPMAHVVLADRVAAAGLAGRVEVSSAGTGDWHVGHGMDRRALATLREAGYDGSAHRAAQVRPDGLAGYDLVLAMDAANLRDLGGPSERARLFRTLDPAGEGDVPDPYYGGAEGFSEVLGMVERTADALVTALVTALVAALAEVPEPGR